MSTTLSVNILDFNVNEIASVKQYSEILGLNIRTIQRYCKSKKLPSLTFIVNKKKWYFIDISKLPQSLKDKYFKEVDKSEKVLNNIYKNYLTQFPFDNKCNDETESINSYKQGFLSNKNKFYGKIYLHSKSIHISNNKELNNTNYPSLRLKGKIKPVNIILSKEIEK